MAASCTDNAGNSGSAGTSVNYDASAPSINSVTLDRPADSNGWYNHPVHVTFHGSDGGSGISSCTDTTYSGPDTSSTTVNGTLHGQGRQPRRRHVTRVQVRLDSADHHEPRVRLG